MHATPTADIALSMPQPRSGGRNSGARMSDDRGVFRRAFVIGIGAGAGSAAWPRPSAAASSDAQTSTIEIGKARLTIVLAGRDPPLPLSAFEDWVGRSAEMVADYCGAFPVPSLEVTIAARGGGSIGFGQHWDGRWLEIRVGRRTSTESFDRDWVMVHEMLHAAFPDLHRRHRWMQEGLSTYLEPLLRQRAGLLSAANVWGKWIRMMPHGRPGLGDRGLDSTHTWGRVYWGGALFWLVADLRLRQATDNAKSLQDVVRGILDEGGNGRAEWSTRRVVKVADAATGTKVLSTLYAEMALAPGDIDLDALWPELGVDRNAGGEIVFDDAAPLAAIRRVMT
jgi:hypothetical protein